MSFQNCYDLQYFTICLSGYMRLVPCLVGRFAIFMDKKNISYYLGPLAHSSMKIVRISSLYILV